MTCYYQNTAFISLNNYCVLIYAQYIRYDLTSFLIAAYTSIFLIDYLDIGEYRKENYKYKINYVDIKISTKILIYFD